LQARALRHYPEHSARQGLSTASRLLFKDEGRRDGGVEQ
jgi:hypothetical protein